MIPIQLTLQGIYSYQEKQSIDFTRLTEANIFGIFGSVGSGKSTILEAITYALYGRTDRLNLSGDNRNYNMMNLKSNELLIEFIFKTGKDDTEYLATAKSRRNSKQFEDVKALDRSAYKKVNNNWLPIEVDSLETIIGLSYENFKRTIIIPQGKFQEFLQLANKDRTQMMRELFNLDKYELYYKVISLETKNNQTIQNLEGQLQQLGEIYPDQIKAAEQALVLVQLEIGQRSNELLVQQAQESNLKRLKDLTGKINELKKTLTSLKGEELEFLQLDKNIVEYEYCILNFKNLLESLKEITNKISQFELNIASDNTLLIETARQLSELEKGFEFIKNEFDKRELFKQQAEELVKIIKLQELGKSNDQLNERILKGEKVYNETIQKIKELKIRQEEFAASIKEIKSQYPDMVLLSKIKDWFTVDKLLKTTQLENKRELESIQKEIQEIESLKLQLFKNDWFTGISMGMNFTEVIAALEGKKEILKQSIRTLNNELEYLAVQTRLEQYANNLSEGNPCPLCGALSHPQPLNVKNVAEAMQNARNKKDTSEKDLTEVEHCQKQLTEINTKLLLKKEQQEKALQKQSEHSDKLTSQQKLFIWEKFSDESNVAAEFDKADKLKLQLTEKEAELEKISKNLEEENQNKDKFNHAIEEFRHQLTANTAEKGLLLGQIKEFEIQDFENKPADFLQKQKESLLNQYAEIEKTYQTTNNTISTRRKEHDTISGRLDANRKTLQQEIDTKNGISIKLQEQLNNSKYDDFTAVEKILSQILDIEKEKKKVAGYKQNLDYTNQQLAAHNAELGDQTYDSELHVRIENSVKQITDDLARINQTIGKQESDLKKLKTDFETQNKLKESVSTLKSRAEDLKTLKQLFKAGGFVNYISSVYLQELCFVANERFYKLTRQKLSLEVTDDNNFQVRDFMNGGKVRNVKTLSGGQTFQAALSLALALADNIQKITESNQNFFFLDEGFGSLDKESLDIVFDTLKSLRKENRIVGVISHVEEMQQEIDTHLKIINDEENGSLVKASWN